MTILGSLLVKLPTRAFHAALRYFRAILGGAAAIGVALA